MNYYFLGASRLINDEGRVYDDFSRDFFSRTKIVGMKMFATDKETISWQEIKTTLNCGKYVVGYPVQKYFDLITTFSEAVGMWRVSCPIEKVTQVGERWLWGEVEVAPELVKAILELAERMRTFKGWCLENRLTKIVPKSKDSFVSLKLLTSEIAVAYFNFERLIYSFSPTKKGWKRHPIVGSVSTISNLSVEKNRLLLVYRGILGDINILQLSLKNYRPAKLERAVEKLLLGI
jgi:hypothetical protein